MIAGAGAAYLNGGLGIWEFAFTPVITFLAFKGLQDYRYIGAGWLMHTAWDLVHHRYGTPIVPFAAAELLGRGARSATWSSPSGASSVGLRSRISGLESSRPKASANPWRGPRPSNQCVREPEPPRRDALGRRAPARSSERPSSSETA